MNSTRHHPIARRLVTSARRGGVSASADASFTNGPAAGPSSGPCLAVAAARAAAVARAASTSMPRSARRRSLYTLGSISVR